MRQLDANHICRNAEPPPATQSVEPERNDKTDKPTSNRTDERRGDWLSHDAPSAILSDVNIRLRVRALLGTRVNFLD